MLRRALYAYGVLYLAVAVGLYTLVHASIWLILYLVFNGALIVGGLTFERRYRPARHLGQGEWQATGERFVDPTSGKLMEVRYNPATGERAYVPVEAPD
jgi:hypothetical protein